MGTKRSLVVLVVVCGACDAADNTIAPETLELRDLLGFEPAVAAEWDADQRAGARGVIARGLAEPVAPIDGGLGDGIAIDDRVVLALADVDDDRADGDRGALGLVRIAIADLALAIEPVPIELGEIAIGSPAAIELRMANAWNRMRAGDVLVGRGDGVLAALAADAGHGGGEVVVIPAPRLTVVAAYVDAVAPGRYAGADGHPHLLVNPVLLAALEPATTIEAPESGVVAPVDVDATPVATTTTSPSATGGVTVPIGTNIAASNPYSFYGSVGECAYAEQLRCDACVGAGACVPRTDGGDGAAECAAFAADLGRGYSLWCANMSVAIGGIAACLDDSAPACPYDASAVERLDDLADNAIFVDDPTCLGALDACLADLFGDSEGSYPPFGDDPPRNTSVGCSDNSSNCECDPSCSVEGPSCSNSLSCGSTCADSSSQSGCGGCGDSCESSSSTSSGGGGCGVGCEGSDPASPGGDGCDTNCSSDSSSSGGGCGGGSDGGGGCGGDGGGGCGGDSGGGGCGGGDSGGDSCGGGGGGGGGCSGGGGGGGSTGCNVVRRPKPNTPINLVVQIVSVFAPIPIAALVRRRARRRPKSRVDGEEVVS